MSIYRLYPAVLPWDHQLRLHQLLDRQNDAIFYAQAYRCATSLSLVSLISWCLLSYGEWDTP